MLSCRAGSGGSPCLQGGSRRADDGMAMTGMGGACWRGACEGGERPGHGMAGPAGLRHWRLSSPRRPPSPGLPFLRAEPPTVFMSTFC